MTDDPTDPVTSPDDTDDAAWFRAAVGPTVDGPIAPDAWTSIRDRATSGAVAVDAIPPTPVRRPRPWLLVAAAVAAFVIAAGVVVALTGGEDGRERVATDAPSGPSGFYVPGPLPAGWELSYVAEQVDTSYDSMCPCQLAIFRSGDRLLSVQRATLEVGGGGDGKPWDGAPGGERYVDSDGDVSYSWQTGEEQTFVYARGFDGTEADPLVEAWVGADLDDPPGFEVVHRGELGADVRAITRATGMFSNEELGLSVPFQLSPDPLGEAEALVGSGDQTSVTLPTSGLRAVRWAGSEPGYRGAWPGGASFAIGSGLAEGATSEAVTDDQVLALADVFEPASAAGWRAFVEGTRSAGRDQRSDNMLRAALIKPRLADLVLRDGDQLPAEELGDLGTDGPPGDDVPEYQVPPFPGEGADPPETSTAERPTTSEQASTTTAMQTTVPGHGGPAVDPAIEVRTGVDPKAVPAGQDVTVTVLLTNPTEHPIVLPGCFPSAARWGLQHGGREVGAGGGYLKDCGERAGSLAAGDTLEKTFSFSTTGFDDQPLAPGTYDAVLQLDGLDELHESVTITG